MKSGRTSMIIQRSRACKRHRCCASQLSCYFALSDGLESIHCMLICCSRQFTFMFSAFHVSLSFGRFFTSDRFASSLCANREPFIENNSRVSKQSRTTALRIKESEDLQFICVHHQMINRLGCVPPKNVLFITSALVVFEWLQRNRKLISI
jgi:hypothetical protein